MRFCFIVEERYREDIMPMIIAEQLLQWGHIVDVIEPQSAVTCLTDMGERGYDAYVLKSLAEGAGLSLLEAAEAVGIPTINNSRAIRLVRDKAVAAAFAHAHGLPMPETYFVAHLALLEQFPPAVYPLVVKPSNGSSCRNVIRLNSPSDLAALQIDEPQGIFYLAQRYAENSGYDMKVYVTGREVYAAIAKKSPLHATIQERFIPLTQEIRHLALQVGQLFGLDIYGIDLVETPQGLAIVDINDFPSFAKVPRAVTRIAEYVLHAATRAEVQRERRSRQAERRRTSRLASRQEPGSGTVVQPIYAQLEPAMPEAVASQLALDSALRHSQAGLKPASLH
jgi:ribosomal protein S6--L-glutamate ligase